mmetsp:Transcript_24790/g.49322  ORF Transcript_24790/g.49322 Transcript_24790/m.49322 type:complete len:287 (+) Transcript_24790:221-1081(+)
MRRLLLRCMRAGGGPHALSHVPRSDALLHPVKSLLLRLGLGGLPGRRVFCYKIMDRLDNFVGDRVLVLAPLDCYPHVGLIVEFRALLQQARQLPERIVRLQQRTVGVALDPAEYQLRRGVQPHDDARLQLAPVLGGAHYPAPGAHNAPHVRVDAVQHLRLNVPETLLPFRREDLRDADAGGALDHLVGVEEAVRPHALGHHGSHRALAAPHHAHEVQVGSLQAGAQQTGGVSYRSFLLFLERVIDALAFRDLVGVLPLEASRVQRGEGASGGAGGGVVVRGGESRP